MFSHGFIDAHQPKQVKLFNRSYNIKNVFLFASINVDLNILTKIYLSTEGFLIEASVINTTQPAGNCFLHVHKYCKIIIVVVVIVIINIVITVEEVA